MKCRSFCPFTAVVAFVGLIGLGVAGYAMLSDNCIFGTCGDREARATDANIVTTAATSADTCPLGGCESDTTTVAAGECKDLTDGCVGDGKGDCCGGCGDEAATTLAVSDAKATCEVATCETDTANVLTVAAKGDNGDNGEAAEECAALTGDCKGDGKSGCCGNCLETEKPAEKKACCQEG